MSLSYLFKDTQNTDACSPFLFIKKNNMMCFVLKVFKCFLLAYVCDIVELMEI